MVLTNLKYYNSANLENNKYSYDVVIYGATVAGVSAAVQLGRGGYSVSIVELGNHVGGMTTSGLSATDLGHELAIGGLAREFYDKIQSFYNDYNGYNFEPKVASKILAQWINEENITLHLNNPLSSVISEDGRIRLFKTENGNTFQAKIFIDASYEGDLLNKSGISNRVGREANSEYKEIYNGIQFKEQHHKFEQWIDPYVVEGEPESGLLKGIQSIDKSEWGYNGKADKSIQAYNFRICLTDQKENKVPFPKPDKYNSEMYELLLRYIYTGQWDALNLMTPLPNNKYDLNNFGAVSTDFIGANHEFPVTTYEKRESIYQMHKSYNMGLLYFLSNDQRVPKHIRSYVSSFGLPKDEFTDTGHWPPQLYIRESRRMISDYVIIDRNCLGQRTVEDSIGLASYHMDSHNCRRFVMDGRVVNEGDVEIPVSPFPIPYRSIRPKKEECENLLVPVCLSSSHIAYGAIRMEPVFMILGQSAGVAAKIAIENNQPVQDINYNELKDSLSDVGQVTVWNSKWEDDPVKRMKSTFGKES